MWIFLCIKTTSFFAGLLLPKRLSTLSTLSTFSPGFSLCKLIPEVPIFFPFCLCYTVVEQVPKGRKRCYFSMSPLQIQNNNSNDFTLVSNRFLDLYMPETNGEFVKIYLYLLRSSVGHVMPPTLEHIADTLNCTEKDIERALKYWCKKKILALAFDDKKHITTITFFDLDTEYTQEASAVATETAVPNSTPEKASPISMPKAPAKPTLTAARVKELKSNEEIAQLIFVAEQYLGKMLSPNDIERLLYFYEDLHFSPELIEYLIEYCVSKGHKSLRYIETVALAWHEEGITTIAAAKSSSNDYNKNYYAILKSFGISNRNPVEKECKFMDCWLNEYAFSMDIIAEACNLTILRTGKPGFEYADKILTAWNEANVRSLSDVASLDKTHKNAKPAQKSTGRAKTANKFNNFSGRNYDFDELKKLFVNKKVEE